MILKPAQCHTKAGGTFSWALRATPPQRRQRRRACARSCWSQCGLVEGREGSFPLARFQLLVYGDDWSARDSCRHGEGCRPRMGAWRRRTEAGAARASLSRPAGTTSSSKRPTRSRRSSVCPGCPQPSGRPASSPLPSVRARAPRPVSARAGTGRCRAACRGARRAERQVLPRLSYRGARRLGREPPRPRLDQRHLPARVQGPAARVVRPLPRAAARATRGGSPRRRRAGRRRGHLRRLPRARWPDAGSRARARLAARHRGPRRLRRAGVLRRLPPVQLSGDRG